VIKFSRFRFYSNWLVEGSGGGMSIINIPNILVIDDSHTIRSILSKELEKMGFMVSEAADGLRGLEIAESGKFDLIITDVDMPLMSGFEVCNKLKSMPSTQSTPVIILSARDSEEDIERGFSVGADAYLTKNGGREELRECVTNLLERNSLVRGRAVLMVDRSRSIREIINEALVETGFKVKAVSDTNEAIQSLEEFNPDLILCDLETLRENEFSFLNNLHSEKKYSEVPLILMSASMDRVMMRRMLQNGASAFLIKPFSTDHLLITCERLLSEHFKNLLREKQRLDSEREIILGSITSLVLALEARDRYTRGHSDSVARIAVSIAEKFGLSEERVGKIKMAGSLHDIGKIGIRDDILLKAGPLNDQEFAIIKLHPTIGASILSPIESLADTIPAILNHHERMDGKGYPQALKGDKIPLFARIIAVADTFDALTTDRPYRKMFSEEKAFQIMEEVRGTQLCPDCLDAFFSLTDMKFRVQKIAQNRY
jgi:response regulator RpfG family c-di-GMP phosphodiesterase